MTTLQSMTTLQWVEFWFKIVGIVGGILAAIKIIYELHASRKQKVKDLQWKQANSAQEFMKVIHANKHAAAAIAMLDWFVIDTADEIDKTKAEELKYEDVLLAMPKIAQKLNKKERYILDCFDWFFYYIDRTEQYIQDGFFSFENVKYIFFPYFNKINANKALYENFMKERCYLLAPNFWNRFSTDMSLRSPAKS